MRKPYPLLFFPEMFHDFRIGRGEETLDLVQDGDDKGWFEVRYAGWDTASKENVACSVGAEFQHAVLFIQVIQEGADLFSLVALCKTGCDLDLEHGVYAVV